MKLDMDLVKKILQCSVDQNTGMIREFISDENFNTPFGTVLYHAQLLENDGFIANMQGSQDGCVAIPIVTMKGHEFLAKLNDGKVMSFVKDLISKTPEMALTAVFSLIFNNFAK